MSEESILLEILKLGAAVLGGASVKGFWDFMKARIKHNSDTFKIESELYATAMGRADEVRQEQVEISMTKEEKLQKDVDLLQKTMTEYNNRTTERMLAQKDEYIAHIKKENEYLREKADKSQEKLEAYLRGDRG